MLYTKAYKILKAALRDSSYGIYKKSDLWELIRENWANHDLKKSELKSNSIVKNLLENTKLKEVTFRPTNDSHKPITRYIWGEVSPYDLALSLKPDSYFSHGTAVYFHGLNEQIPKVIYIYKEQKHYDESKQSLTQDDIDNAFKESQRKSNYEYAYQNSRFVIVHGKGVDQIGVEKSYLGDCRYESSITSLERTLIDITVRPAYAGGIFQVLAAYEGAKENISTKKILTILKKMNHKYPYHQAIGFLMERAGYSAKQLKALSDMPVKHRFYLDYNIAERNKLFDEKWCLYFPKGL